jgi:hypothetical protein
MKKIIDFLLWPIRHLQERRRLKKRLEELRKRDPFIYK